jgi:hypothetical protein
LEFLKDVKKILYVSRKRRVLNFFLIFSSKDAVWVSKNAKLILKPKLGVILALFAPLNAKDQKNGNFHQHITK